MGSTDRVVVDSSVIIAYYNEIDDLHSEAVKAASRLEQALTIIHPYVIQEVTTLLTYRRGIEGARQFLEDIRSAENVIIAELDVEKDMLYFLQVNRRIAFTDVALVRLAKEVSASLLTFDRQLYALFRQSK